MTLVLWFGILDGSSMVLTPLDSKCKDSRYHRLLLPLRFDYLWIIANFYSLKRGVEYETVALASPVQHPQLVPQPHPLSRRAASPTLWFESREGQISERDANRNS
ncbi:Uncharacterized protein Fot_03031 [Forsythia ovata]|uniref:Uncharacterized protein n=1 Tax=Forsythia ovata TaxID=205694 RepID=A0ABD1X8N6_9LAMI